MKKFIRGMTLFMLCFAMLAIYPLAQEDKVEPQTYDSIYLYRTTFIRAAPGKLLDLIQLFKDRMEVYDAAGDERPFWWRHTQGDQWDLMMLFPMESYTEYFSDKRVKMRIQAGKDSSLSEEAFLKKFKAYSAWHEDMFVRGPSLENVKKEFKDTGYYHCEIFIALPGKYEELYKEREMENVYQTSLGRPYNMIFTRDWGASWDLFTLGCYRDLTHWATRSASKEDQEAAAAKAGFESADKIGPYMRTLIYMHRDTMGVAIK